MQACMHTCNALMQPNMCMYMHADGCRYASTYFCALAEDLQQEQPFLQCQQEGEQLEGKGFQRQSRRTSEPTWLSLGKGDGSF